MDLLALDSTFHRGLTCSSDFRHWTYFRKTWPNHSASPAHLTVSQLFKVSIASQVVKNLPAMQETPVDSWVRKILATHSSILAWRISWTEKSGRLPSRTLSNFHFQSVNYSIRGRLSTSSINLSQILSYMYFKLGILQQIHSEGDQPWDFFGGNDAEAETPVLWPLHAKSWLIGKDSDAGRDWGQEEKGTTEDEMAGWHHWLDGCESEWTPGVGDGQGGLACCSSWGGKESDTTERLNWSELTPTNKREKTFKVTMFLYPNTLFCLLIHFIKLKGDFWLSKTVSFSKGHTEAPRLNTSNKTAVFYTAVFIIFTWRVML